MNIDAGLAAVMAGGAGFLGAVIGSALQGRATQRAAVRQAEAALHTAEAQARGAVRAAAEGASKAGEEAIRQIAHQSQAVRADWLRQQRVDASMALLSTHDTFATACSAVQQALDGGETGGINGLWEAVLETDHSVAQAYFRVRIFGPDGVKESAVQLRTQVHGTTDALRTRVTALSNGQDAAAAEANADEQVRLTADRHSQFVTSVEEVIGELAF